MIDYHTHILPQMDDGSHNAKESALLIRTLERQGVSSICLTPHFYRHKTSIPQFLENRQRAFTELQKFWQKPEPELLLGAEVAYFRGIAEAPGLSGLCLEGTDILLLEMPFARWDNSVVQEVKQLSKSYTVLLAHIERYYLLQNQGVWKDLQKYGVCFQSNAEFFFLYPFSRIACSFVEDNVIDVLGTDTHNTRIRSPHMDIALRAISKRYGKDFLEDFIVKQDSFLQNHRLR